MFYDDNLINTFIGAGAVAQVIDEFNGDNFDRGPHGFLGGGYVYSYNTNGRPIQTHPTQTTLFGEETLSGTAHNHSCVCGPDSLR